MGKDRERQRGGFGEGRDCNRRLRNHRKHECKIGGQMGQSARSLNAGKCRRKWSTSRKKWKALKKIRKTKIVMIESSRFRHQGCPS